MHAPSGLSHVFCSYHSNDCGSKETSAQVKDNDKVSLPEAENVVTFRCVLCRAKILRLKQHHKGQHGPHRRPLQPSSVDEAGAEGAIGGHPSAQNGVPQSVSNYSITRLSSSSSNHSFASGVSSVSSGSSVSVRSVRSFNFDNFSNFQNVNLVHKNHLTRTTVSMREKVLQLARCVLY